jgi:hypothetical protein
MQVTRFALAIVTNQQGIGSGYYTRKSSSPSTSSFPGLSPASCEDRRDLSLPSQRRRRVRLPEAGEWNGEATKGVNRNQLVEVVRVETQKVVARNAAGVERGWRASRLNAWSFTNAE